MTRTLATCAIGLALVAAQAGCDKHPTAPTHPEPPKVETTGLQVTGPDRIAPGATAQLTAMATKTDGSTEDVTARVTWRSDHPEVVSVASDGRATGVTVGSAVVMASLEGLLAYVEHGVVVVPANTFVLSGTVRQSSFPIAEAKVEVVSAAVGGGMSTASDAAGHFALFGVAGAGTLRVGKDDYSATFLTFDLSRDRALEVELHPLDGLPLALSGTYAVTFSIAACTPDTGIPSELLTRKYQGHATTQGDRIDVRLSGATFVVEAGAGDRFSIWRTPGEYVFKINDDYYYAPDIHEQLSADQTLAIYGTGRGTGTDKRLTGSIDGGFVLGTIWWDSGPPCTGRIAVSLVKE